MRTLIFLMLYSAVITAESIAGDINKDAKYIKAAERFLKSEIVQQKSCNICHTIGNSGGTVGPILNQISNRRSPDWLRKWLKDPNEVKPGTKMPNFQFSDTEIEIIIEYFKDMKRDIVGIEILARNSSLLDVGKELFQSYDCLACHRIGKTGRFIGPNLTWLGIRKTRDWETVWLRDPNAYKPGTFMPNFHLGENEIEALTTYLSSLTGGENETSREWESITAFFLDARPRERGRLVAERLACWSCHGPTLDEGIKNPNALPDEFVPPINTAYLDFEEEDLMAIIMEGSKPLKVDAEGPEPPFSCPPWKNALDENELDDLLSYLNSIVPESAKWEFE